MSKIIVISSDHHLVYDVKNVAAKKACQVEHYTEQEWKNKKIQAENSNVVSIRRNTILPEGKVVSANALKPLNELQIDMIQQALYSMNGNVSRVSKALNIGRATLYRKIKDYDIDLEDIRNPKKAPIEIPMAS